ncbi:hypothetical protein NC653_015369 [Populus alba x Populus x berolinensis]|uniref:FAS1 domain-containing protein n=1 Tax=Populus alba x Populus x berolinensis TaxID=444605 RepID=A0AAD6VY51_9ROSI|nr:hypothetical protein NC653_015369 [Populus alba x Populus x berolinensis]
MTDTRSQNFFGLTFFLPIDQELTRHSMSPEHLEDFMLSHSIPMPPTFSGLNHFPTGTMVPSGLEHQLIEIKNRGKADFSVNNAQFPIPDSWNMLILIVTFPRYMSIRKDKQHWPWSSFRQLRELP